MGVRWFFWIVGLGIAAVLGYGLWTEYQRGVTVVLAAAAGLAVSEWKFILALGLLLWVVRELRLLRYMLCRVFDQLDPVSQHFDRIESQERSVRVEARHAELERESWRNFVAESEKTKPSD